MNQEPAMWNGSGQGAVLVALLLALVCRAGLAQIGPRYVIDVKSPGGVAVVGPAQGSVQLVGKGLALVRFQGLRLLTVGADADAYSAEAVRDWPAVDLVLVTPASAGRYGGLAPLAALRRLPVVLVEPSASATVPPMPLPSPAPGKNDGPHYYPMQAWDALHLRKGKAKSRDKTWLRVTAMPGQPGTAHVAGFVLEMGNRRTSYRLYVSCAAVAADEIEGLSLRLPGVDLALLPGPQLLPLHAAQAADKPAALTVAGYAFRAIRR
ncbi:hypothetical protein NHH82_32485 [Oxalobacteraceae bacterium OTU3REALA1]|nr:hypothetical protein NHH82_32485 [Oxalobacteraceae bacterium OTU3REALA1]